MGTFSVANVAPGQYVTASVFNNLVAQINNLNTLASTNFPATTAIVANVNLKAPNAIFTMDVRSHSVAAGATCSSAGSPVQARNAVLASNATLIGISYYQTSLGVGCSVAGARLYVNNSTAIAASVNLGQAASIGTPVAATVQTALTKTSFAVGDRIELKSNTPAAIHGLGATLHFKAPHKA